MNITDVMPIRAEVGLLNLAASTSFLRPTAASFLERVAYHRLIQVNKGHSPEQIQHDKLAMVKSMIHSVETGLSRGLIGPGARNKLADVFLGKIVYKSSEVRRLFMEKHGMNPPGFVLISPTARCNLEMQGLLRRQ